MSRRTLFLAFSSALLAIVITYIRWPPLTRSPQNTMTVPKWQFTAQRDYFSHDSDPESWDFRATTQPSLGLYEREFPTDTDSSSKSAWKANTKWDRFLRHVEYLNSQDPDNKQYKVFYLVRHGQGIHNVKEAEVGRLEWDRHWSKLAGDGTTTWLDAKLTPTGEQQARDIANIWQSDNLPTPQSIYSSPLRRALRTTALAFAPFIGTATSLRPMIKEKLRECNGVHTCDKRSPRSWIASAYPEFAIESGMVEEDELWDAEKREEFEEHAERSRQLLEDIFENDKNVSIALVAHTGSIRAIFAATGWKKVPVATGSVYPLLVCRSRINVA